MPSIRSTLAFWQSTESRGEGKRSLVQIHPVDLDRGPIQWSGNPMIIGRSSTCDLRVADRSVSRQHAEIRPGKAGPMLHDLGSTNGVCVNGLPVEVHPLSSGDCIQLGSHVFRFLADDDLESQYQATVYSMMTRDGLTGTFHWRYLEETLRREVARSKRHARPLAVIMMDIDVMGSINLSHGHVIGDQVLRGLCTRLQNTLREDDVLARCGGDDFTIAMVEANIEDAADIAERCRIAVASQPIGTTIGPVPVTISLGVAAPEPVDLGTSEELIKEAEERLFEAKRAGRNRTVC